MVVVVVTMMATIITPQSVTRHCADRRHNIRQNRNIFINFKKAVCKLLNALLLQHPAPCLNLRAKKDEVA